MFLNVVDFKVVLERKVLGSSLASVLFVGYCQCFKLIIEKSMVKCINLNPLYQHKHLDEEEI